MAVLSQTDLDWIRDWVGSTPSDDSLGNYYDDLGAKEAVAWRILSRRRADLMSSPSSVAIPGVVSVSNIANIAALEVVLNRLMPIAQAAGVDVGGLMGNVNGQIRRKRHGEHVRPSEYAEELGNVVGITALQGAALGRQINRGRWQGM